VTEYPGEPGPDRPAPGQRGTAAWAFWRP